MCNTLTPQEKKLYIQLMNEHSKSRLEFCGCGLDQFLQSKYENCKNTDQAHKIYNVWQYAQNDF